MTDSEIIAEILKGDENLYRSLINKYKDQVLRTCYGFTQSQSDAEDIAQEVFIEIYESLYSFRHESKFSTWIYRISVNKSLNFLRKKRKASIFSSLEELFSGKTIPQGNAHIDNSRQPDDFTDPDEELKRLKQALKQLPETQKTALTLYTYQNLSYKQIAEIMNITLASVESLIFRAKKNLRKILVDNVKSSE